MLSLSPESLIQNNRVDESVENLRDQLNPTVYGNSTIFLITSNTHMHARAHTHTHTHSHTYNHTHTHTQVSHTAIYSMLRGGLDGKRWVVRADLNNAMEEESRVNFSRVMVLD